MKYKKGITLMEIIVSIALISIVMIFLFNVLANIRNEEVLSKRKSENLINQALVIKNIQDDLADNNLISFAVNNNSITFTYEDNITKELTWDENSITYNNEKTTFRANINNNAILIEETINNHKFFIITIPIIDRNQNFNIEIVHYQYIKITLEEIEDIDPYE